MHRADEIIPWVHRSEFAYPILLAGQIIHFQRELDCELRKILLRAPYLLDVFAELVLVIRQLSKLSLRIGEWSEKPISVKPFATASDA